MASKLPNEPSLDEEMERLYELDEIGLDGTMATSGVVAVFRAANPWMQLHYHDLDYNVRELYGARLIGQECAGRWLMPFRTTFASLPKSVSA